MDTTQGTTAPETTEAAPKTWDSVTKAQEPKEEGGQESAKVTQAKEELSQLGEADLDKFIEVPINGKVERVKVREALKHYGIEKAARQKMSQADQKVKQYEARIRQQDEERRAFAEDFRKNPEKYLKQVGHDTDALAEEWLAKKFEMVNMSPEQQRAIKLEMDLKLERAELEKLKNERQQEQMSREEAQATDQLNKEVAEAWTETKLPADRRFGIWVSQLLYEAAVKKEDLSPKEAAAIVKERFVNHTADMFRQMDAAAIHEILGDDVLDKLRQYGVEKVTGRKSVQTPQKGEPRSPTPPKSKKAMNEDQWRDFFSKIR